MHYTKAAAANCANLLVCSLLLHDIGNHESVLKPDGPTLPHRPLQGYNSLGAHAVGLRPLVTPYVLQDVCHHLCAIGGFTAVQCTATERAPQQMEDLGKMHGEPCIDVRGCNSSRATTAYSGSATVAVLRQLMICNYADPAFQMSV